jgi:molybdate transport system substrate-binding protein
VIKRTLVLIVFCCLLVAGCGTDEQRPLVFVAASMADVATQWRAELGDSARFDYHAGASLLLARQIASGARADLFLAAGIMALEPLPPEAITRIDSGYLHNYMVLICAPGLDPPKGVEDLVDARFRRIAVADPELAPAGDYARTGLVASGLWDTLSPRFLFTGDVRMAAETVRLGSADAGLVYATEVKDWDPARVLWLDTLSFPPAHYPLVMLGPVAPSKEALWTFLHSPQARDAAKARGFK